MPSLAEISALSRRQELLCTVHCPGAGACPVAIDSHTTAGEVRPEKDSLLRFHNPPFQLYLSTVLVTEPRVSSMLGILTSFSCRLYVCP